MKKIGLALGAGGARGLAHIKIIQAFEELGIQPAIISGTSIGAIVAVAYAAGLSSKQMIDSTREIIFGKNDKYMDFFKKSDFIKILDLLDPAIASGGFIKGEKFMKYFSEHVKTENFEELKIATKIVTTEYWSKSQRILSSGKLLPATRASYSLPAMFTPVKINGELLMDGGLVNPLPLDIIYDKCDISIGIDVSSKKSINPNENPSSLDILFSAFQIMQNSIMKAKLAIRAPDILIQVDIKDIRLLEFNKAETIWEQAEIFKESLKEQLKSLLD